MRSRSSSHAAGRVKIAAMDLPPGSVIHSEEGTTYVVLGRDLMYVVCTRSGDRDGRLWRGRGLTEADRWLDHSVAGRYTLLLPTRHLID